MTMKPTADQLAKAIEASGMTHREIADRVGINHVSAISMMIQGITRVPLQRIPALAQTLGMNERAFLVRAIKEYHPDVYEVLVDLLGLPLSDAELDIVATFRLDSLCAGIDVTGPFKSVLKSLLERARAGQNQAVSSRPGQGRARWLPERVSNPGPGDLVAGKRVDSVRHAHIDAHIMRT